MRQLTIILLFITSLAGAQSANDRLIGVYESKSNGFEWYSIMTLDKGNRFIYKSGLGGCRVEVKGTWTIENKKLKFVNDKEFFGGDTVQFPNLGLTTWTIKKFGIRPDGLLDKGFCLKGNKLHRKR